MLPQATVSHYRAQQRLELAARAATARLWRDMGPEFDASWTRVGPRLVLLVTSAQVAAAAAGADYVGAVLEETGQAADPVGEVDPQALAGVASDGRPLGGLLYGAVTAAKEASGNGADPPAALEQGRKALDLYVLTQVADAARVAAGIGIAARDDVGYVRMLNPPSCSRCAILAGRWYGWNKGFQRHPRCDCRHVPSREDLAGDLRTDPAAYFRSLSTSEQDRIFTKAGAQAVRDGADLGQVVNARRAAQGLAPAGGRLTLAEQRALRGGRDVGRLERTNVFGREVFTTREGVTRRGLAGKKKVPGPRLMPESIYEIAGDSREEAIRLLQRFGYLI
jgi:hypothetical protein